MHKVTSRDGTPIAVERRGDGPPLISVGGAFNDRSAGAPLAELLAARFTVYCYDRRGRGDSGDTQPYAVGREIEDLQAVIADAGGSACVYGMSSGAALALEAAARGSAITRLALFEPPYNPAGDGELMRGAKEYETKLVALLADRRHGEAVELFLTVVGMSQEMIAQVRTAPMWAGMVAMAPTLAYEAAVMGDSEGGCLPAERAAAVAVPTLVLSGGRSPQWMGQVAQQVADAVQHGRHAVLEDQTHDVDPRALAPVLEDFFAR
ncbi:Lysophospholipase, alpha-beta hydrolase superfamily [Thermomonospora echinospora]|uniref:Lysophospholipase, alpha-beta hydrolase superfamily n=1 Tax=Thermomonospora echinospora TaxID=1992 RepID=A0A1H5TJN8_9ACTN|nr:alpha/beta hydrolase [Thermomonospora echinospora]SEF63092.1 Lysophospholipase, alpha-beta hydrolase superfamily [Thermomonospora echinospora]